VTADISRMALNKKGSPVKTTNWKNLSLGDREKEYSPSSVIGDNYLPFIRQYSELSAVGRNAFGNLIECKYGPELSNTLDLILPETGSSIKPGPLVVFIHGGYWQELSKKESLFPALGFVNEGIAFAALDYTLCPKVSLKEIVAECRTALEWLEREAANYYYDPERIIVAGSSAGAHLAAMCALNSSEGFLGPAACVLVSGIYDLEPLIETNINEAVKLTREMAFSESPLFGDLSGFPQTLIAWGEHETNEFKFQSNVFAEALKSSETILQGLEVPGRNHFDVILDLASRDTILGQQVFRLIKDVCK
jgi:arylformamidase